MSTHVLVAPDKFKGSLTAREVADAIATGIGLSASGGVRCTTLPLADGGDGSIEAAVAAGYDRIPVTVNGPTGDALATAIAFDGHTAIVEVASTAGLSALPAGVLDPLRATSYGVGEAVRFAIEHAGARRIVIALGGSATTDGGAGMLEALGASFFRADGLATSPRAGDLSELVRVDLSGVLPLAGVELVGASDVRNPLVGPSGAARIFAPQKGAGPSEVDLLERGLERLRDLTDGADHVALTPGSGSAGGLGYAVLLLGGSLVSGADFFLDLLDFDALATTADLVITGEGSLDAQTLGGKLVSVVVARTPAQVPVVAVVGRSTLEAGQADALGLAAVHAVAERTSVDTSSDAALTARLLARIGGEISQHLPEAALPRSQK